MNATAAQALLLAIVGGLVVMGGVFGLCALLARHHSRQFERAIRNVYGERTTMRVPGMDGRWHSPKAPKGSQR